jgi:hypothetical protein
MHNIKWAGWSIIQPPNNYYVAAELTLQILESRYKWMEVDAIFQCIS